MFNWEETQEAVRPAQRHQGDRHRHRPGLSLGRLERLRRPAAHHAGRQAPRPYRRRQSRHLFPFGDGARRGRHAQCATGTMRSSSAATPAAACPATRHQAGSLTASTQSRTMYVAAMDMKAKLTDIAAQMLGGKADDYELGDEKVVRKADAVEVDHLRSRRRRRRSSWAANIPARKCPTTSTRSPRARSRMIAGTGPHRRRQGQPAARRHHAGPDRDFAEIELDTETGKFDDQGHAVRRRLRHRAASAGPRPPDRRRQRDGHRHGHLERHVYDPKLGIPATLGFHQGEAADLSRRSARDRLGRRSTSPIRRTRSASRASANRCWAPAPPPSPRRSPTRWAGTCSTARRSRRT